jgi:hypothetical protein
MAKYAFIQNDDTVGMIVEADSIELAQEVASNVYGTKDVVALEGTENGEKASPGCAWDGTKFIPLAGTELDEEFPTVYGTSEEPVQE